jgi:transglutaminase-like putative cysteine protease
VNATRSADGHARFSRLLLRTRADQPLQGVWSRLVPVVAFAALAGFASAHWSALVVDPPGRRTAVVVLVAAVGGAAAASIGGSGRPAAAGRAGVLLLTLAAGLVAIGVAPAHVWPGGWDRLVDGLGRGFAGLRTLEWPYGGPDPWVRLTVLTAIPATLVAAAALTFRPPAGGRARSVAGLVLLLALYGVATAQHDVGSAPVQGAMLLLLIGAWLFLPRIRRNAALAAAAMVLVALAAALPLASGLATSEPMIDYRSWQWLGDPTRYDWNHAYGPIEWPRSGETVLTVESRQPHYWKAAALDRFDGLRWVRSEAAASVGPDPLIPADAPARWTAEVEVTVGALDSTLLVTPGSTEEVEGVPTATSTRDGAARAEEELEQGSRYTVRAYAPNPSVDRLRAAPDPPPYAVRSATIINLPPAGRTNLDLLDGAAGTDPTVTGQPVVLPRYDDGLGGTPAAEQYVAESPYAPVLQLARGLVEGAPTTYDAVQRVEAHLREQYEYEEQPPHREYPLAAFLAEDRAGYCQHFAGAMALMLRMSGIPARVAAGFAPGERSPSGGEFTVRDLDAHSWVEVYFSGIGWVPFDPTPPGAPTASRADGALATAARGDEGEPGLDLAEALAGDGGPAHGAGDPALPDAGDDGAASPGEGGTPWVTLAAVVALAGGGVWLSRRRRAAGPDAAVQEIERALRHLGRPLAPGATLLDLERALARSAPTGAARYVRRVREQRFAGRRMTTDAADRRALRRALTARTGPLGRARGYTALPPWRVFRPD